MSPRTPILMTAAALVLIAPPAGASGGGSGADAGGVFLVPMQELTVPIVDGPRAGGRLRLKLVLRATDADAATRLQQHLPALREASFGAAAEFARLYASPYTPVDARRLATDLNASLHRSDHDVAATLLVEVAAVRA